MNERRAELIYGQVLQRMDMTERPEMRNCRN